MKKTLIIVLGALSILLLSGTAVAYAMMQKEVTVSFSDKEEKISTSVLKGTPASVLESEGYDRKQLEQQYQPSVDWDTPIQKDTTIHLVCHCEVTLKVGADDPKKVKTTQTTVGDFLKEQQVKVDKNDQVNAEMDQKITNDLTIVVDRIEKRVQKKVETTDFQTKEEKDPNLPEGEKKVTQEGKEGKAIYQVTALYKNGKAMVTDKKLIEKVDPVHKIVKVGSGKKEVATAASKSDTELASSGESRIAGLKYSKTLNAQATGYTHTGNPTATGVMPKRGTVAVDPNVIPLGTKLYIPGYGQGVAQDTGGAVRGNIVDLFFDTREEAIQWGRRNVTVYILE